MTLVKRIFLTFIVFWLLNSTAYAAYEYRYYLCRWKTEVDDTLGEVRVPEIQAVIDKSSHHEKDYVGWAVSKEGADYCVVRVRAEPKAFVEIEKNLGTVEKLGIGERAALAAFQLSPNKSEIPAGRWGKTKLHPLETAAPSEIGYLYRRMKAKVWGLVKNLDHMARAWADSLSDDFNRADENLWDSANWTDIGSHNGTDIVSNELVVTYSSGDYQSYRYETELASADHYAEIDCWHASPWPGTHTGPTVRVAGAAETFYWGLLEGDGGDHNGIFRMDAGTPTQLATDNDAYSASTWYTIRIEVEDNGSGNPELTHSRDAVEKITDHEDSSASKITGNKYTGLCSNRAGGSSTTKMDTWLAADSAAAPVYTVIEGATLQGAAIN